VAGGDGMASSSSSPASASMDLQRPLYKESVGSKRMCDGLKRPGKAEVLLEWMLRTIGTVEPLSREKEKRLRQEVFGVGVTSPPMGTVVEGARRCLREAGCLDAARAIPNHGGRRNVDWKRFEVAADFDLIEQQLREAYATKQRQRETMDQPASTQVFSPHELLNRPRGRSDAIRPPGQVQPQPQLDFVPDEQGHAVDAGAPPRR